MGEEAGHDASVSLPVLAGGLLVQFGEVLLWHWHYTDSTRAASCN